MSAAAGEHERRLTVGISLKLYLSVAGSVDWAASLARIVSGHPAAAVVDVFAAPSFPALPAVQALRAQFSTKASGEQAQ